MMVKQTAAPVPLLVFLLTLLLAACSDPVTEAPRALDAAAVAANNHAVGLMGRFEYANAQAEFSSLASQWPEWSDFKVNLAIATLNKQQAGDEEAALELAREVIEADPANLRAHYVAGLIHLYLGATAEARAEFSYVTGADPEDAHAAYYLAQSLAQLGDYAGALPWFERAMKLNPYLRSAYYGGFQSLQRLERPQEAQAVAADYQRLENNPRSVLAEFKYTRMGPKGEALAIDLPGKEAAVRPPGALFTDPEPLVIDQAAAPYWRTAPKDRFSSFTTADMKGDSHPDLFITGAIEVADERGETLGGNLVLQGRGDGSFSVDTDHPLATVDKVNAALWGDYDNDGLLDVYLCRNGQNQLWRQTATDHWQDVTESTLTAGANLDTVDGAFFDADHDGDLDLFLVNGNGPNELLNNNLDGSFRPLAQDHGLAGQDPASIKVLPADIDNDRDADLIVLNRNKPHEVYINDRLWSYRPASNYAAFANMPALAVVAADIDADGQIELYSVNHLGELLRWQTGADGLVESDSLATPLLLKNVKQLSLATNDVDGDAVPDLIVTIPAGWMVLSIGADAAETLFSFETPTDAPLTASLPFISSPFSGPAMLTHSANDTGLSVWRPGPGRFPFITLALSGRQENAESMRSNASGIGSRVSVRTGSRWSLLQTYRNHSGPGQSLQPLAVGLNGEQQADFVSIDWSDGVFQSEIGIASGQLQRITETQRQLSSCPVLFAWNGQQFAFVSDILGVGGMGFFVAPGEYATPRPRENFLLPEGSLQAKDGHYQIKIGEPMEENAYLDAARLAVYDLPPGWQMVLDERMGILGPEPSGEARFYRYEQMPVSAVNDRGEQTLDSVLSADGVAAPVGELDKRFIGRLENEHILTLDFPQPLDLHEGLPLLVMDGWVEYPYSQTNFAAWQAGATYDAPTLEAFAAGKWQMLHQQFGYPAGMPRRMSVPLNDLPQGTTSLRLRTNMQVYWDRIAVAYAQDLPGYKKQFLPLSSARLGKTGFAKRINHEQFRPDYDYQDLSPFWDTRYMSGYYTRLGSVDELVSTQDDAVAVLGPGEEVHLEFETAEPVPVGWRRYFVLETNGWAKDMDLFTGDGETVGPLPSTGKPETIRDQLHAKYNTRYQSGY
jgi:hypothetical protein